MNYHYKLACLTEILKYYKNDQILESHYQWQEEMLKQEKYKIIASRYDLKIKISLINNAYVTSIFRRNTREEK